MRATLTLDDDVAAILKRLRETRHARFKDLGERGSPARLGERRCPAAGGRAVPDDLGRSRPVPPGDRRQRRRRPRRGRGRILPVILVDANLLVYAHVEGFPQHESARKWLDGTLNRAAPVGLPWESLLAFLRLVTNPRVFEQPEPCSGCRPPLQANRVVGPLPGGRNLKRRCRDGSLRQVSSVAARKRNSRPWMRTARRRSASGRSRPISRPSSRR